MNDEPKLKPGPDAFRRLMDECVERWASELAAEAERHSLFMQRFAPPKPPTLWQRIRAWFAGLRA